MTRTTNARIAGVVFLLYIATGITSMVLSGQITGGAQETAARLASIAEHATLMRVNILLTLLQVAYAVVLGVTLYALTRDQDRELAIMGLCCRVTEGVVGATSLIRSLALLSIATAGTTAAAPDAAGSQALASLLFRMGSWTVVVAATCFAVGSLLFSYLFLRARSIPVWLAWLGVVASALLVVALPLRLAGFVSGPVVTLYIWLPMLVFEVVFAFWLIIKGVATQARPAVRGR
ncbi:MAG TPA: DUF4386 domain-containing protein [Clostridia bacterium]|nr:DUF4386 domain-containing protein [Clostridia bacterium]